MLVGDVRMKISRVGVSWTLSGGNQEVCGPTNSSKYLQVRRADRAQESAIIRQLAFRPASSSPAD